MRTKHGGSFWKECEHVSTYQEASVAGLVLDQWFGLFVPAGTPLSIATRLNAEIDKVARAGVRS